MSLFKQNSFLLRVERLGLHGCALRSTVLVVVRSVGCQHRRIGSDFACHAERHETKQDSALSGQQSDGKIPPIKRFSGTDLPAPDQLELLGLARFLRPAV